MGSIMGLLKAFAFCGLLVFTSVSLAGQFYNGSTLEKTSLENIFEAISVGQVTIVSELHGFKPHHENQKQLIQFIQNKFGQVSVGMEFINYTQQSDLDLFGKGDINESEFLNRVKWGGAPFENYRDQLLFPFAFGNKTVGLNMPRSITSKVAKQGFDVLTEEEKKLLSPIFATGTETLKQRFSSLMKDHLPDEKSLNNYFAAHSIWDDTMAWQASQFIKNNPNKNLVIIVGDFHLAYLDGLVARLKKHGVTNVLGISQTDTSNMTTEERAAELKPHPVYGPRADYIFDNF